MSALYFEIKRGDREPSIERILMQGGAPMDLTGCTVKFLMRNRANGLKINAPASVIGTATAGHVRYDFLAIDTDIAGKYNAEFEVTKPGNKPITAPTNAYITVIVYPDLG